MTPDVSPEAEQAVLGALICDHDALAELGEFSPDWFTGPHRGIAQTIRDLADENRPIDAVTIVQRGASADLVFALHRAIGTTANVRHYATILEGLWAKREAKKLAKEILSSDTQATGEEFVGSFAQRLTAIQTRKGGEAKRLAQVMFDRVERIERYQNHPEQMPERWATGFAGVDALTGGLRPGNLWLLAALRKVGKTAIVSAIADNLGMKQIPVGWFVLEGYADAIAERALMRRARVPSTLMRDGARWGADVWSRVGQVIESRCDLPIFIDDTHDRNVHDLCGAMRRMHREHGCKVFIVDNLVRVVVDKQGGSEERHDQALGRIAMTLANTAFALGAAVILVHHLRDRELDKRSERRPRMSDIRNSGELADVADVVALMWRDEDSDELNIDIAANRQGPSGPVVLEWDGQFMAVREKERAA